MKLFQTIFSIYLIVLSCLPCADLDKNVSSHSSKEITSKTDNHSHEKSNDDCSPFCVCNCCGSHVFINREGSCVFNDKKEIVIKLPEYQSLLASSFFKNIWQPPKINDII